MQDIVNGLQYEMPQTGDHMIFTFFVLPLKNGFLKWSIKRICLVYNISFVSTLPLVCSYTSSHHHHIQTSSVVHPSSYLSCTSNTFPWIKQSDTDHALQRIEICSSLHPLLVHRYRDNCALLCTAVHLYLYFLSILSIPGPFSFSLPYYQHRPLFTWNEIQHCYILLPSLRLMENILSVSVCFIFLYSHCLKHVVPVDICWVLLKMQAEHMLVVV
jgi:hypothetical protein